MAAKFKGEPLTAVKNRLFTPSATASPCVFPDDTYYCSAKGPLMPAPRNLQGIWVGTIEAQVRQTSLGRRSTDWSHRTLDRVFGRWRMLARRLTPILNVSNIQESFAWFEKLGWTKAWDWGTPPTFGGVCSGECEIFLCQNGQGGRGKSSVRATFGPESNEAAEKAVWMSIWVDDVDVVHQRCVEQGLDVTWPPTDMPWNAREMHVRHPDGHVFRISRGIEESE